jgi:amidase
MTGFDVTEATVADVHAAFAAGDLTAVELVDRYRERVAAYDGALNAVLTHNDAARERAAELDERFAADGPVGPLHGVPIVLKDNHETADLPTTAGSAPLADLDTGRDATVVERLRAAGAVVLAKTNLQELAYGVDTISSLGGATRNAYDTDRRPSGSSGGTAVAVAANLALAGTGSDTCSSVRSPPGFAACVGVRPTQGLVSRDGIVPLSSTQDTAGPIARTVADAARLLTAMAGYDPADPATAAAADAVPGAGYADTLDPAALDGARIGVARAFFGPGTAATDSGETAPVTTAVEDALDALAAAGATVVDPVEVPHGPELERARVLEFEFARDFDAWLDSVDDSPVDSLADLVATGEVADTVADRVRAAGILDHDDGVDRNPDYLRRLRRRRELRNETLATLHERDLDAVVYPPSRVPPVEIPANQPFGELNCELAAHTGLPAVVVPAGFTDDGLPVGLELLGRRFEEPHLLSLAAGVEDAVDARRPPAEFGPL